METGFNQAGVEQAYFSVSILPCWKDSFYLTLPTQRGKRNLSNALVTLNFGPSANSLEQQENKRLAVE